MSRKCFINIVKDINSITIQARRYFPSPCRNFRKIQSTQRTQSWDAFSDELYAARGFNFEL